MVKLIPKAETHFENGETHFKNGETHFKNSETHFFGILRKWPLLDFAQTKSLWYHYVLQLRKFQIQKLGAQDLNYFKIWDGNPEGP